MSDNPVAKYIPYPAYKDSCVDWLGAIPQHWQVKKIKYLTEILRGKFTHRPRNDPRFYDGIYPFIQTGDISNTNKYITTYQQTLNELGLSVSKEFPRGTLVMSIAANIGDLAILDFAACFPDSIVGFVPKEKNNLNYLYYNFIAMKSEMMKTATLNTQLNLNVERIKNLFTVLPPIAEQEAIASYLDKETTKTDTLIAAKQRLIALLKEKRTAKISHVVTKGLNPNVALKDSGIEWLGAIPQHWELKKIKWFAKTNSGSTPNSSRYSDYYQDGVINWVRTVDLNDSELWSTEIKITKKALEDTACKVMPVDTVMIAMYGGDGTIGKNGILKINAAVNQAICCVIPNKNFVSKFLHRYVQFCRPYWMIDAMGTRKDPNINQQIIKQLIVALPPIAEQEAIASYLDKEIAFIDSLIEKNTRSIELLKEHRTALISAAVTGKIDVRETSPQ